MMPPMLVRISLPNKWDLADFGTLMKVQPRNSTPEWFIQLSTNADDPRWESLNAVNEKWSDFVTTMAFYNHIKEPLKINQHTKEEI